MRRFVVGLRGARVPESKVVITTAAGEEAQVDYGDGPMVREPTTGKFRRTRHYDHAATLVACCVEVDRAASAPWVEALRARTSRFPAFPAFQDALRCALGGRRARTISGGVALGA